MVFWIIGLCAMIIAYVLLYYLILKIYFKLLNQKIVKSITIINKLNFSSPLYHVIKIANNETIFFSNIINKWKYEFLNIFDKNFKDTIMKYEKILVDKKIVLIKIVFLHKIYLKMQKIESNIKKLNNFIKENLFIKDLQISYKLEQSKKFNYLCKEYDFLLYKYPFLKKNEKIQNKINKINNSIEVIDEALDNGELLKSIKLLFKADEMTFDFFDIIYFYSKILDNLFELEKILCKNSEKVLQDSDESDSFIKIYNENLEELNNKYNSLRSEIYDNLKILNYEKAIKNLILLLKKFDWFENIYGDNLVLRQNLFKISSDVIKNIEEIQEHLQNLNVNSKIYIIKTNSLLEEEKNILSENYNNIYSLKIEMINFMKNKDKLQKEFLYSEIIIALIELIKLTLESSNYIEKINNIYNKYNKEKNDAYKKIIFLKNKLNHLVLFIKKQNSIWVKKRYFSKINSYFKSLVLLKQKKFFELSFVDFKLELKKIDEIEKKIDFITKEISDIFLLNKLTEKIIVYNNRYLVHFPEIFDELNDAKKAFNHNEIDLSFSLSLSILNRIWQKGVKE